MTLTIRRATRADEAEVQRVIRAVYDEYGFTWDPDKYHADLYNLDRHYHSLGDIFWVAEDQYLVGTIALELFSIVPGNLAETVFVDGKTRVGGCDCSLERLYVHPDARGRGVGRALVQTVIDQAQRLGRSHMEIWSDKRFEDAHRLYERFGARVVGERICDDPDISPEWGLILRVS